MSLNQDIISQLSAAHPRADTTYAYGTAGFRTKADVLDSVLFRVGMLAALRSAKLGGQAIGVMVTASHNPEQDNGVKLVDPLGEMLHASWEAHATALANAASPTLLLSTLSTLIKLEGINLATPATVVYGYDTRPSCPALVAALEDGFKALAAAKTINAGLVTTPQLHYLVRCLNTQGTAQAYGEPTLEGYYDKLARAYATLATGRSPLGPLTVDCANGVGAPALSAFLAHLASISAELLPTTVTNDATTTPGALNYDCGADYVKTQQRAPPNVRVVPGQRYASFDGDADRIVYYYATEQAQFRLLDGDKIAGLAAGFIRDEVDKAGLELRVGVVQTAYANGASTEYLERVLELPVACTKTGVKHLHHAALDFDIGVYFEANGHGTVLFSPATLDTIARSASPTLIALTELINQTVGDALSDMLLVETVLLHRGWTPAEWDAGYDDLPNRLVKVFVEDRTAFEVTNAERTVVRPAGLQAQVDAAVAVVAKGRSFLRASGTEDCVRVYAEAATREDADALAQTVSALVFDLAGKGDRPAKFT